MSVNARDVKVPRTREAFETVRQEFTVWLTVRGCEVHEPDPKHGWEVFRYKPRTGKLFGIIYRKDTGQLTYTGPAGDDIKRFIIDPSTAPVPTRKTKVVPKKQPVQQLITDSDKRKLRVERNLANPGTLLGKVFERDGDECWYCGKPLGYDITKEHLLARAHGGHSLPENIVLAHQKCNSMAGHLPVDMKRVLRDYLRRADKAT